jgi:hypothetical protein
MAVYVSNIVIEQGYSFETSIELEDTRTNEPLILTNASIESTLKKTYTSSSSVSFASSITNPAQGIISISLTSAQTAQLKPGRHVYDIKIIDDGIDYKAVEGSALVRPGVTT